MVSSATLPAISGRPLSGDDAEGRSTAVESAIATGTASETQFRLPDRYTMVWNRPRTLVARRPEDFTFTLLDPTGHQAQDTQLYMGMLGHAAFVKTDGSVFAHIHPSGTVSMAALMMAQEQNPAPNSGSMASAEMDQMPGMTMPSEHLPSSVSFPYGFPTPGQYRIFVQMKHGDRIETAIFDATVGATTH
jgi:hypothetical protein